MAGFYAAVDIVAQQRQCHPGGGENQPNHPHAGQPLARDQEMRPQRLLRLLASDSARAEMGLVRGQVESEINTTLNASLREALGPGEFEDICASAASNAGLIEISEYVSRSRGKRKRPLSGWPSLTPTEHRVVSLVVEGLTNPQIAERMFIARGTVKIHLAHIFDKLDVKSRAQLAANATAQGMKELN